jgi:hypothetical protein
MPSPCHPVTLSGATGKERLKWVVGEPVVVELVVQNPLAIAVFVPQMTIGAVTGVLLARGVGGAGRGGTMCV